MITYERFTLKNGLRVLFHKDETTPLAVVNILYNVGARDEESSRTGFAHLFEHLMFGGSKNIENFDNPLQLAGGECNAFTNNDITNYYDTLPVQNLETAFWLESDRMLELAFTPKSLEVQRSVVIEEFKQRYLNQPYGDVWLLLRPLIYKSHPYQWATIGKEISHIVNATMEDVKSFFFKYYGPDNAVMVVGGNTTLEEVKKLSEKWFGDIPSRGANQRNLTPEPTQQEERELTVERDVPSDAIYMAFRMGHRMMPEHYTGDLASDILSRGKSSRLYDKLISEKKLFSTISAYISGGWEDGLFVVSGNLNEGVSFETAKTEIWNELEKMRVDHIDSDELIKVKNKFKTGKVFSEQSLMNRVMNIAFFEMMGKLDELNDELKKYDVISSDDIRDFAKKIFVKNNLSTLMVKAKKMNRTIAPPFKLSESLSLVIPQEIKLENDITLFWMKDVKDDSVKLDIEWFAGTKYQEQKLAASFTNKLLLSGNANKNAKSIAAEMDFYGGFIQDEIDKDHAAVTLYGLRENFHAIFKVFEEAMLTCEFPEREFEEERTISLSKYKIDSGKVKYLCQRKFNTCLFGIHHPYGQVAEEPDFLAVKREDLIKFHNEFYLRTKPVLFLVGNVDDRVIDDLRTWSSKLGSKNSVYMKAGAEPKVGRTEIIKEDAIQSAIRIGRIVVDKKHKDYFGLQILDTVLGGYFGSRLMTNIREDKGYTYGIGSACAVLEDAAYFFVTTEVAKEVKEDTIKEIYFELNRLTTDLIPADELERVKNYMLGEFLRQSDGPAAMMESFKNLWFNKLEASYYTDFIHAIHTLTAEDLRLLAQKYFVREQMVEVVVG